MIIKNIFLIYFAFVVTSVISTSNDYEDYEDEPIIIKTTTTTTAGTTTEPADDYYEDDTQYDDDDYESGDGSNKNNQPFICPVQCKCKFNKLNAKYETSGSSDYDDSQNEEEEDEDYANESQNRRKRSNSNNKLNRRQDSDYGYDDNNKSDEEEPSDYDAKKTIDKYEITVDCSSLGLTTISDLFDYDFPLEQIVNFNLSFNKFRQVRLDEGFEDLINLKVLDFSGNNALKGLSPRNFLKKFRHLEQIYLNNLTQIECIENQLEQIDCNWFKTMIYLYKRNISTYMNTCNLIKDLLVSSNTTSISSLMHRCFFTFNPSLSPDKKTLNGNKTVKLADINSIYEFSMEPEINQILIEGDTLELTCKLKRMQVFNSNNRKLKRPNKSNSGPVRLKWYLNNTNPLVKNETIQIINSRNKYKTIELFESKLIIKNTQSAGNSGKYSCSVTLQLQLNLNTTKTNYLFNTSQVGIQILSKNELNQMISDKSVPVSGTDDPARALYCSEMSVQTYKGIYKWPKTKANSKTSQNCASLECLPSGQWSKQVDINTCPFESNLTRYLNSVINSNSTNLEQFIHTIISIQSDNKTNNNQINMYDIQFIQKFLLSQFKQARHANETLSFLHRFTWLNDLFFKLNRFQLLRSAEIDKNSTFSTYFFTCLLKSFISLKFNINYYLLNNTNNKNELQDDYYYDDYYDELKSENDMFLNEFNSSNTQQLLLSGYMASITISNPNLSRIDCSLDRFRLTQQLYFNCSTKRTDLKRLKPGISITTGPKSVQRMTFVIFDNDKLFPYSNITSPDQETNYDPVNLGQFRLFSYNYLSRNKRTCSQVLSVVSTLNDPKTVSFNATLQIKIPSKYMKLIELIETNLTKPRANNEQKPRTNTQNLFDLAFKQDDIQPDANIINIFDLIENDADDGVDETVVDDMELSIINDTNKLRIFRQILMNKWLNKNNYEIVYGSFVKMNSTYHIEWVNSDQINNCQFKTPERVKYRLYVDLFCNFKNTTISKSIKFISLRHITKNHTSINTWSLSGSSNRTIFTVNRYAYLNNIQLDESATINSYISKYQTFKYKIVYFCAVTSCILLLINIFTYLCMNRCLLMPRSFFHCLINTWISVLAVIIVYIFGIKQIYLSSICLSTSMILHYLTQTVFIWYALYFYCLYFKLKTLKDRNFNLIFNQRNEMSEIGSGGYIKKPVLQLYMLAWGLPLLLCSIIIAITKQDYIQPPFGYCFTNEPHILIGSLIIPIGLVFIVQIVFIILIAVTLRRILNDLKKEEDNQRNECEDDQLKSDDDKIELCKKWAAATSSSTRTDEMMEDLKEEEMIELKMNPQTQKSLIIRQNYDTNSQDSDVSYLSDQTSVMDTQHKPNLQLRFALISWIIYVILCVLASFTASSEINLYNYMVNVRGYTLFTYESVDELIVYLMSIFMIVYSLIQFCFYVLSRDDLVLFEHETLLEKMNILAGIRFKNWFRKDKLDSSIEKKEPPIQAIEVDANNDNNWYFETPASSDPELPQIENKDQIDNKESKNITIEGLNEYASNDDTDDDVYNEHNKKSISDVIFSSIKKRSPECKNQDETLTNSVLVAKLALPEEEEASIIYNPMNKKSHHVRNPSVLSGNINQNMLLLNGSGVSNDATLNNYGPIGNDNSHISTNTVNRSSLRSNKSAKKPVYVFVDYKYEEKVLKKLTSSSNMESLDEPKEYFTEIPYEPSPAMVKDCSPTSLPVVSEPSSSVSSTSHKLDDLLNNSCSAHTGTALSSIPSLSNDLIKSKISSCGASTSNGPESLESASSIMSSSNDSSTNLNYYKDNIYDGDSQQYQIINHYDDGSTTRIKYLNQSNRSSQLSNYGSWNTRNYMLKQTSTTLSSAILKTNIMRTKEFDMKTETSV